MTTSAAPQEPARSQPRPAAAGKDSSHRPSINRSSGRKEPLDEQASTLRRDPQHLPLGRPWPPESHCPPRLHQLHGRLHAAPRRQHNQREHNPKPPRGAPPALPLGACRKTKEPAGEQQEERDQCLPRPPRPTTGPILQESAGNKTPISRNWPGIRQEARRADATEPRETAPDHYRACPECELNNAPANNQRCPNCNHDPDRDVTPEQAQALDAVPECYDMGAPEVRTFVLALRDPGTPQERRKPRNGSGRSGNLRRKGRPER